MRCCSRSVRRCAGCWRRRRPSWLLWGIDPSLALSLSPSCALASSAGGLVAVVILLVVVLGVFLPPTPLCSTTLSAIASPSKTDLPAMVASFWGTSEGSSEDLLGGVEICPVLFGWSWIGYRGMSRRCWGDGGISVGGKEEGWERVGEGGVEEGGRRWCVF